MINLNLASENNYTQWELDEKQVLENAKNLQLLYDFTGNIRELLLEEI